MFMGALQELDTIRGGKESENEYIHATMFCQTSVTQHKIKCKIIKNIMTVTTEHMPSMEAF